MRTSRNKPILTILLVISTICLVSWMSGCSDDDSCSDADGDGRCDGQDLCPGEDDTIDSDNDVVPDCLDGCPNDPAKLQPGACGCGVADTDGDSDGVPDCLDECTTDPDKIAEGACGCGTADTDVDGDNVPNCLDGCPNDIDKLDPGVCGCGVADTDTDGDLVPDCDDGCPNDATKIAAGVCGCGVADTDTDLDGTPDCDDCAPRNPEVSLTAPELCNGQDDNCDGSIDEDGCPCETAENGGQVYMFCDLDRTRPQAVALCASYGYHLVTIDATPENTWLRTTAGTIGGGIGDFFTGYSDGSDEWYWDVEADGDYTNWATGEPGVYGNDYDWGCAVVQVSSGEWLSEECDEPRPFVCEFGCEGGDDTDNDGTPDGCDPCPNDAQNDTDGDGYCADADNCPADYNPNQTDTNNNGVGDVCEQVLCGDGILDPGEECDDGNTVASDGCSATCQCETADSGLGPSCPNTSCDMILADGFSHGDGFYYIDPSDIGTGMRVYCDMTLQGGGWTLVAIYGKNPRPVLWTGNAYPRPGASNYGQIDLRVFEADNNTSGILSYSMDASDLWGDSNQEVLAYVGGSTDSYVWGTLHDGGVPDCNFFDGTTYCEENTHGPYTIWYDDGTVDGTHLTENAWACTTAHNEPPWTADGYNEFGLHLLEGADGHVNHCIYGSTTLGHQNGGRIFTSFNRSDGGYWNRGIHSHWNETGVFDQPGALFVR